MKLLCVFIVVFAFSLLVSATPDCPTFTQVTTCSPKCKDDGDCVALGGKCCPNLCNFKSCVTKANTNKSGDNKYNSNGGAGSYCNNVKCNAFEKCEMDRVTKRMKCVRS